MVCQIFDFTGKPSSRQLMKPTETQTLNRQTNRVLLTIVHINLNKDSLDL